MCAHKNKQSFELLSTFWCVLCVCVCVCVFCVCVCVCVNRKGFDITFELLGSVPRTGCQSIIVFATDGLDTDGEQVRCGPGEKLIC